MKFNKAKNFNEFNYEFNPEIVEENEIEESKIEESKIEKEDEIEEENEIINKIEISEGNVNKFKLVCKHLKNQVQQINFIIKYYFNNLFILNK